MRRLLPLLLAAVLGACARPSDAPPPPSKPSLAADPFSPERDEEVERRLREKPTAADLNWRGRAKTDRLDFAGAHADFTEAIRLKPTLAAAWLNRGNVRIDMGDDAGALGDLREAERLDPSLAAAASYAAGVAKASMGDARGAAEAFQYCLRAAPVELPQARLRLADALSSLGETSRAMREYDSLLEKAPERYAVLSARAAALESVGEAKAASDVYRRLVAAAPDEAAPRLALAQSLHNAGLYGDALAAIESARELLPEEADVYQRRGYVHYYAGRPSDAAKDWERAISMRPSLKKSLGPYLEYARAKTRRR